MLMNNHGRCMRSQFKDPENATQAICDFKNKDLLWLLKRRHFNRLNIKNALCNERQWCVSTQNVMSYVSVAAGYEFDMFTNWDVIGDGTQLATGNNCLAIQGDTGDIGSRAIIAPCDPKQKSQNWFFAWL